MPGPASTTLAAARRCRARSRSSRLTSAATAASAGRSASVKQMPWSASSAKPQPRKTPLRRDGAHLVIELGPADATTVVAEADELLDGWRLGLTPSDGRGGVLEPVARFHRQPNPPSSCHGHVQARLERCWCSPRRSVATLRTASEPQLPGPSGPLMSPPTWYRGWPPDGRGSVHHLVHEVVHRALRPVASWPCRPASVSSRACT